MIKGDEKGDCRHKKQTEDQISCNTELINKMDRKGTELIRLRFTQLEKKKINLRHHNDHTQKKYQRKTNNYKRFFRKPKTKIKDVPIPENSLKITEKYAKM